MSLLVILITTLLAYFAYGYNVTLDGEVDQRGLVFVSSQPSGSQISIDGKRVGSTGARLVVSSGTRELRISRTGYHDWVRTIDVRGSSVSHFTYPFLIPTSLTTNDVTPYDAPLLLATQSPDRRWLITQTAGVDTFELFDLNRNQATVAQTTSIMLDDGLLSAGTTTSWEAVDWAGNNRHTLILRSYTNAQNATATEYILLDRQRPAGSHNLTRELQLDAQVVVSLRDKKPDSYYLYNQESKLLSSASLDNPAPIAILENVLAYAFHDKSRILYATTSTENPDMVDVLLKEWQCVICLEDYSCG